MRRSISPLGPAAAGRSRRATITVAERASLPYDRTAYVLYSSRAMALQDGRVAELADALGSGSSELTLMGVQVPPRPPSSFLHLPQNMADRDKDDTRHDSTGERACLTLRRDDPPRHDGREDRHDRHGRRTGDDATGEIAGDREGRCPSLCSGFWSSSRLSSSWWWSGWSWRATPSTAARQPTTSGT